MSNKICYYSNLQLNTSTIKNLYCNSKYVNPILDTANNINKCYYAGVNFKANPLEELEFKKIKFTHYYEGGNRASYAIKIVINKGFVNKDNPPTVYCYNNSTWVEYSKTQYGNDNPWTGFDNSPVTSYDIEQEMGKTMPNIWVTDDQLTELNIHPDTTKGIASQYLGIDTSTCFYVRGSNILFDKNLLLKNCIGYYNVYKSKTDANTKTGTIDREIEFYIPSNVNFLNSTVLLRGDLRNTSGEYAYRCVIQKDIISKYEPHATVNDLSSYYAEILHGCGPLILK